MRGLLEREMLVHLDAGVKDPESGLILGKQEGGKPRRDLGGNMGSRSGCRALEQEPPPIYTHYSLPAGPPSPL